MTLFKRCLPHYLTSLLPAIFLAAVVTAALIPLSLSHAATHTYYVDSVGGSDSNDGLSTSSAWQTLTKVNTVMTAAGFAAGDTILLDRGETFTGNIVSKVDGSSGSPLTIGAYGTGAKPLINATGNSFGVDLRTRNYNTVQDIAVENATTTGILLFNGNTHITLTNLDISHVTNGIRASTGTYSDITITDCTTSSVTVGAYFQSYTSLTNLTITGGTYSSGGNYGVAVENAGTTSNVTISGTTASSNTSNGIRFSNTAGTMSSVSISNTTTNSNGGSGIQLTSSGGTFSSVTVSNVTADSNTTHGLQVASTSSVTLNTGTFSGNTQRGISVSGSSSTLNFNNITADNNGAQGILYANTTGQTISTVTLTGGEAKDNADNGFGIDVLGTGANYTITNFTAESNDVDGFNVHGTATNVIFDNCSSLSNGIDGTNGDGDGYSYHDTTTGTIKNSLAQNNKKSGIGNIDSSSVTAYNNILTADANEAWALLTLSNSATATVTGNTLYNGNNTGTGVNFEDTTVITFKDNIIDGFATGFTKAAGVTLSEDYNLFYGATTAELPTGYTPGSHTLTTNPQLTNPSGGDYTLLSNSPAIDTGFDTGLTDRAGNARYDYPGIANAGAGTSSYYDIGAYELVTPPTPSLKSSDCPSGSDSWCNIATPTLSVTASSSTTTYFYLVTQTINPNNTDVEAGTSNSTGSFALPSSAITSEGTWYVQVIAKSNSNIYSSSYGTYLIRYDHTAPTTPLLFLPAKNGSVSSTTPAISWLSSSDALSGVVAYQLYIDDSLVQTVTGTSTTLITPLGVGDHTWQVAAVDAAGNSSDRQAARTFTVVLASSSPAPSSSNSSSGTTEVPTAPLPTSPTTPTETPSTPPITNSNNTVSTLVKAAYYVGGSVVAVLILIYGLTRRRKVK